MGVFRGVGPRLAVGLALAAGCARDNPAFDALGNDGLGSTGKTTSGVATTDVDPSGRTSGPGSTTDDVDPSATSGSDGATSHGVVDTGTDAGADTGKPPPPDCPSWQGECDLFTDQCANGSKCAPVEVDGVWGAQCVPTGGGQAGDECVQACGVHGGADDCGNGLVCWFGTCTSMCDLLDAGGCEGRSQCVEPVVNQPGFGLCQPSCNPFAQDCPGEQTCLPDAGGQDNFTCFPSPPGAGTQGDTCEYYNACAPGFACVTGDQVSGCLPADNCCTALCLVGGAMCEPTEECTPLAPLSPMFPDAGVCTAA